MKTVKNKKTPHSLHNNELYVIGGLCNTKIGNHLSVFFYFPRAFAWKQRNIVYHTALLVYEASIMPNLASGLICSSPLFATELPWPIVRCMLCLLIAFCAYIILVCQKYPHFMWFVCSLISRLLPLPVGCLYDPGGSDWSPHNLSLFLFHAMKASLAEYSYYRQARIDVNQLEHNRVWRYCPRSEWLFSLDK